MTIQQPTAEPQRVHADAAPPAARASRPGCAQGQRALGAAAGLWLVVMIAGQWAFFYYLVAFYGTSTFSGDFEVWNRLSAFGRTPYIVGDTAGNLVYASHALAAGIIAFGGALQLIPWLRTYAPAFHRYNGRLFLLTVMGLSLSGFYLVWIRRKSPSVAEGLSTTINGVLILAFAYGVYARARAKDFLAHRRWALRLYLVSNAQWFLRIGFFGYFVVGGIVGYEAGPDDPFPNFWTYGCYLAPLAMLELYLRAEDRAGTWARLGTAGLLIVLTAFMAMGIFAFGMFSQAIVSGEPLTLPGWTRDHARRNAVERPLAEEMSPRTI